MKKNYYLLGEILWGMKDYFIYPNEEELDAKDSVNSVNVYEVDLGPFDGLSYSKLIIGKGMFKFQTGNYSGTPQYERDKRRFFIVCGNINDKIHFFYDVYDENIIETLKKILTIKISKKLLHKFHQQMIENSGVLNIRDITKITYTPLAKGVYYIDNNEILEQRMQKNEELKRLRDEEIKEKLNVLFPPASAEEVRKLQAKLQRDGNEEKPVMVDSSGQRNAMSRFRKVNRVCVGRSNLLDVIPLKEEKEPTLVKKIISPKK